MGRTIAFKAGKECGGFPGLDPGWGVEERRYRREEGRSVAKGGLSRASREQSRAADNGTNIGYSTSFSLCLRSKDEWDSLEAARSRWGAPLGFKQEGIDKYSQGEVGRGRRYI